LLGQRYDFIVIANEESIATDFWIRAIPQSTCSDVYLPDNVKGILHYGDSTGTPSTSAWKYTDECVDEPLASLVPVVTANVAAFDSQSLFDVTALTNSENKFRWYLNSTTMLIEWENPVCPCFYSSFCYMDTLIVIGFWY
jgi:hypothetical protein